MLRISDLDPAERVLAEDLVRHVMAEEPTGEEPLLAVLDHALRAVAETNVRPVFDTPDAEPRWIVADRD